MVHLKVYDGQEKVEVLELKQEIVSVGRDPGNTLVLPDPSVSRNHAQIEPRGNFYLIRDHASTNGTFVNEMLVRLQILGHGDTIRIGKYLIRVDTSHSTSCEMTQVRVEGLFEFTAGACVENSGLCSRSKSIGSILSISVSGISHSTG